MFFLFGVPALLFPEVDEGPGSSPCQRVLLTFLVPVLEFLSLLPICSVRLS